jgi:hypothetical protein
MKGLGRWTRRIESEFIERLQKVKVGLRQGWQPPGLLLKGGSAAHRSRARRRLADLAEEESFLCTTIIVSDALPLRDCTAVCRTAIRSAELPQSSLPVLEQESRGPACGPRPTPAHPTKSRTFSGVTAAVCACG